MSWSLTMGRHSTYTLKLADGICTCLGAGESLRSICSEPSLPSERTVIRPWSGAKSTVRSGD